MSFGSLDPEEWEAFRVIAHRAVDDAVETLRDLRERPPWRPMPFNVRQAIVRDPLPREPHDPAEVYLSFLDNIEPYAVDNRHPRFFGWVHGAGTVIGVLAELLAAMQNANVGGRDHAAVELERCVIRWWLQVFAFPATASGILTSGSSMANLIGILVARQKALGDVRRTGVRGGPQLVAYTSTEAHSSIKRAFELAGLGSDALRAIPVDERFRIDLGALRTAIADDRAAGATPFAVIATAGSAGTGAVDDLNAVADCAEEEGLWLHVDGAFGALARLSPTLRHRIDGIERADSLCFDFHKWLHVPYDSGIVLVRDGELHRATFADHADYLIRTDRGTAAGEPWFTDFGPELSRGFRALKVWFTMKVYGLDWFGELIARQCAMARVLGGKIERNESLELMAPVSLNIVCFRSVLAATEAERDEHNAAIAIALQEEGLAVLSTTRIRGRLALRMNVMNHRTTQSDLLETLAAVVATASSTLAPQAGA